MHTLVFNISSIVYVIKVVCIPIGRLSCHNSFQFNFSMYSFLFYVFFSLFCVQKIHFFFTGCKIDMYLIFGLNESLAQVGTGGVFVRIIFFHPQKAFYKQCPNAWQRAWSNFIPSHAHFSVERESGTGEWHGAVWVCTIFFTPQSLSPKNPMVQAVSLYFFLILQ